MLPYWSKVNETEYTFLEDKNFIYKVLDAVPQEVNPYVIQGVMRDF